MKKSILTLIVLSIIGTSAVSARPGHRPHPAPRPVVVVERHPDNVATAAVIGGIIGGVIGAIVR